MGGSRPRRRPAAGLIARAAGVPSLEQMAELTSRNFGRVFEAQTLWLESLDALLTAEPSAPANQDTPARAPKEIRKLAGEEDIYLA